MNIDARMDMDPAFVDAYLELRSATKKFAPFNSAHEGFAVLKEEVDELWKAVCQRQGTASRVGDIRREATQVAAMAIRLIIDCCDRLSADEARARKEARDA